LKALRKMLLSAGSFRQEQDSRYRASKKVYRIKKERAIV